MIAGAYDVAEQVFYRAQASMKRLT
jgi:hypothetical protein